jgi:predicted flap endonuclease-1-like 5' DNA nuclease
VTRPARLADAIRDTGRVIGANPASRSGDLSSLRSVRSEAYKPVDATAPTAIAGAAAAGAGGARVGRAAGADDLKRIRGVGVLIEKKLNSMGITGYDQIARWTQADIERISTTLDFKGRIERENWIEQARILAEGGQTEFSRRVDTGEVDGKPRT